MNINHTKMTLEINSCKNYEILEVRQGDKGSRIIDFTFTVNGETVDLTSTMSAKVNATVDDVIVADSVAAAVDTNNNVVTVTLTDAMLALSGICKMDIVLTEDDEIITAETICLRIGKSVINGDSKAFPGASSIVEITKEVENARGGYSSLGVRLNESDATLTTKANKSDIIQINSRLQSAETTLNRKANTADVDNSLKSKEDNSNKVSSKLAVTSKSANYPSIEYLEDNYYEFTELYTSDEVDSLLADKYNSSNIESGSSTLTPYSSQTDKSKSAVCTYKKVGDTLLATVSITLNAGTLGANSTLHFIDLPFRHNSDTPVYFTGISSKGGVFKGVVPKTSTWLSIMSTITQTYTFTDGEQLNFTLMYKI